MSREHLKDRRSLTFRRRLTSAQPRLSAQRGRSQNVSDSLDLLEEKGIL
ncbi:MAG: hypothetical protein ACOZCP_04340 [Pseudomonadota bacterium]